MFINPSNLSAKKYSERGVALITVMLIVALASIIAAQMTTRLQVQMQRSTNISFNQQAYWYALGAEAFSKRVLIKAFKDEPEVTHLEQIWAEGANNYPVDFGEIGGELTDLQSCLNLNALHPSAKTKSKSSANGNGKSSTNPTPSTPDSNTPKSNARKPEDKKLPAATALEELITILNIEGVSSFEAEAMVNALTDWLDDNDMITGSGGAEDNDYASREFPYLAANNFLGSVNELRLVEGFTPAIILALAPFVCVLPQNSQNLININTIDAEQPELLRALLDLSSSDAQSVLSARDGSGYEDIEEFYQLPELNKLKIEDWRKAQFVVDSEYFQLKSNARFNNSYFNMTSIMQVTSNQEIRTISRTIGRN